MCFLLNFGCKIIFMCSVNFCHQQDSKSLFKGSIGHVTSQCKWPIVKHDWGYLFLLKHYLIVYLFMICDCPSQDNFQCL